MLSGGLKSGITGKWLENLQELYSNNYIRSFTPYGKTDKTKLKRGIRQECPLSPLLFAYYITPVAIELGTLLIVIC